MNDILLETNNLTKSYKDVIALKDFSVRLEYNRIYGLLGRNGAGKTTFLDTITSRIFADKGDIKLFGQSAVENQQVLPDVCYIPEKNYFITAMRVSEILKSASLFFKNFDTDYAKQLCSKFGIEVRKKYKALSRGYESILRIIIGLASRAPLTIFDEPVLGLDAAVRDLFYKELIDDYSSNPRSFIVSTHLIEESADVFEEVLIIKEGKLISQIQVTELKEMALYVSGKTADVDRAVSGCRVIHSEMVGNAKISAVFEKITKEKLKELRSYGVDLSPIPIQKLFIYLTNTSKEEMS